MGSAKKPSKKSVEDGAAALFEEANPESGAYSKQSKETKAVFEQYAEAAITGQTSKEREPDDAEADADAGEGE